VAGVSSIIDFCNWRMVIVRSLQVIIWDRSTHMHDRTTGWRTPKWLKQSAIFFVSS
jgi:hypothetical protein